MGIKVGSMVYNVVQGLGVLAKDFYDHGVVTHPVIVERPGLAGRRPPQKDWYPADTPRCPINRINTVQIVEYWRRAGVQALLAFETPFEWGLFRECRRVGIQTILMPMHECTPVRLPAEPDAWFCPSLLDLQAFGGSLYPKIGQREVALGRVLYFTPVPVDAAKVPWKKRERCRVFVHNSGHGGLKGRNGTAELVRALEHVKSQGSFSFRSQSRDGDVEEVLARLSSRLDVHYYSGTAAYQHLFDEGDCFIFPERFNGLSLPLQEARASGMLVMCGDRFPMNAWLPREPLIPVAAYRRNRVGPSCLEFDEALIEPRDIAAKIDEWFDRDVSDYSESGRQWAEDNSWEKLGPVYASILEELV